MSVSRPASARLGAADAEAAARAGLDTLVEPLRSAPELLGAHMGGVYLLSADGQALEMALSLGAIRQFVRGWQHVGLAAAIPVADAVREGELVWVGGAGEMARRYPRVAVAMPYAFSLAAVPLTAGGRRLGAVFFLWPAAHPAELSPTERGALGEIAGRLARRVAAADPPLRAGPRPLPVVPPGGAADLLAATVARLPDGVCAIGLDGRLTLVSAQAARLLARPADQLLGARPWTALPWLRDPIYEYHYRAAVISGEPSSFVALRPPDQWLSFRLFPDAFGVTARIAAAQVTRRALPVDPVPLEPVPHTRPGALYWILHLATALTEAASVQDVVSMVADQIVPGFGGRAVAVLLAEGGKLRIAGHRGYPPGLVDQFDGTPLTESTPGVRASTNPVPAFFENRAELERIYAGRRETQDGMAAWAYLPLVTSGRLIGTCVLAFAEPHHFALEERAVLTALGGLIAQALDRARLYDTKSGLAHGLQDSLLPSALPVVPGLRTAARYLPATEGMEVGGDFYDLIRVDDGGLAVVIGDVQGHNVNAAALMGQIRTAVRAFASVDADPSSVLAGTNRLLADLGTTLLASCAYLRVDLARREAWLADAGHPVPLLRGPDGRARLLSPRSGLVLNVDPDAEYPQIRIRLPVGTTLLLYTDGLVETPGGDLDQALARLADTFARHGGEPLDRLADTLIDQSGQAEQRTDDVAVLLVRSVVG
ncbi:SpoIIE family protein phosphatase [Kitasatospora sp. NBC_01287]|uniref:SpoIIE family protein phosphatase n=1 Tax=Kitasatospora sp. NBC_01287 TaxID=2903573 RepID=UPI002255A96F|nr:SpoIIE family protein phosphatase [Kitasatospora sp. NBC_01287]MCX4744356.1 SpoIIE family protein phosphatase [Kitasatospora sp. NBC_01287]